MENKTVIVIGAVNVDICGRAAKTLNLHDSNLGTVSHSLGGVGRNIAHDLHLLGVNVRLCAAIGDDAYAEGILKSCLRLGIDMSLSRQIRGGKTSCYLYVADEKGEMLAGIADMDIAANIDSGYIASILAELNAADAVVIDGNLSEETVRFVAENVTVPIFADPVSVVKSEKLRPALSKLKAIKPNAIEAMRLTGATDPESAARELIRLGTDRVFVSLGADGIIACEGERLLRLPCEGSVPVNTTGCGDAAVAAVIWATLNGLGLEETARAALKAAELTAMCEQAVNPELCAEKLY